MNVGDHREESEWKRCVRMKVIRVDKRDECGEIYIKLK